MLLCELPLLKLFTQKFREDNQLLFSAIDDYPIDLTRVIGPDFYKNRFSGILPNRSAQRQAVLKKMGVDFERRLTSREIEILKLLLLGYSAGKVATQIHLSKRTVEHHIERIKDSLGCDSKAELIQKGIELERIGCLVDLKKNHPKDDIFLVQSV